MESFSIRDALGKRIKGCGFLSSSVQCAQRIDKTWNSWLDYYRSCMYTLKSQANINSTWIKSSLPFCGFQTDLQSHEIKVRDGTAKNETEKRKKPRKCIWNTRVIFLIDLQTLFWSLSCYPIRCSLKAVKLRCVVNGRDSFQRRTIHRSVFTKTQKFALKLWFPNHKSWLPTSGKHLFCHFMAQSILVSASRERKVIKERRCVRNEYQYLLS